MGELAFVLPNTVIRPELDISRHTKEMKYESNIL